MSPCLFIAIVAALAGGEAEANQPPRLRIDAGHPWRPPFGLDRVGRPVEAVVEFPSRSPSTAYTLTALRKGQEISHQALQLPGEPPYRARVVLEGAPDELVLLAGPDAGGKSKEVARAPVALAEIEAEAVARPETPINPVDLGTILVPAGWLLLGPGQAAALDAAALCRSRDISAARLVAWFETTPTERAVIPLPLVKGRPARAHLKLPAAPSRGDRDVVHVALDEGDGKELWHKTIRAMLVREPPRLPAFGATSLKLRYDAPISVRDPRTGALSTMKYEDGWDPRLEDVVVSLPNGSRYVFWRGSSYIPFWAGKRNTGLCYEWAELNSRPKDVVDCVEPLMDKELRYGRVKIVESTPARVHVRWSYQSNDLLYKVWGDAAVEDYYFYPDGFGTRVVNLKADPAAEYELSEFIVLTPQGAYPLDVLPRPVIDVLFVDGQKRALSFPVDATKDAESLKSRDVPAIYRVRPQEGEAQSAIYFNPNQVQLPPVAFAPFSDQGMRVTPAYWGSHWPLARGNATGYAIDDRIGVTPSHNSLMSWAGSKPKPLHAADLMTLDTLGRSRPMTVRQWAWLIGMTDAPDGRLLQWARSFTRPPALEVRGAQLDFESYAPERRALRLAVEADAVEIDIKPDGPCVNPVFELLGAPKGAIRVHLAGRPLEAGSFAWDGRTLWLDATMEAATRLRLEFGRPAR